MTRVDYAIFVLIIAGVVVCEDVVVKEESSKDNNREVRELDQKGWRAVETFHESDLGWIPRDEVQDPDQIKPKRRRLRKRKRRPPISENSEEEVQYVRRRVRPYRLEPWEEMSQEEMKPNNRRRIPQPYPPSEEINEEIIITKDIITEENQNKLEKPLEASIIVEEKPETLVTPNSLTDLKNLLKQSGGKLSLSEILQQKNLSLSELLKGSDRAISALTEKSQQTVPIFETTTDLTTKYKRLPPSIGLKKESNKHFLQEDETPEILSEKETVEAQRKRLSILQPKENKLYANIIKFDIITEPTTERRIFVPARPKYTDRDTVPSVKGSNNLEFETTTEQKTTSTFKSIISTYSTPASTITSKEVPDKTSTASTTTKSPRSRSKLPATNAKLRLTTKKLPFIEKERYTTSLEFIKPVKININEVAGFSRINSDKEEGILSKKEFNTEGPMRISIDLGETILEDSSEKPFVIEQKPVYIEPELTTNMSDYQNETYVTAKQEIMEVMKDPASREKLSRILEHRNMTLEELVEQRERGSSQRHLADIFHNNTREPEPKDEPYVGHISVDYFNSARTTNRQQKSSKLNEASKVSSTTASSTSDISVATSKHKETFPTVTVKFENQSLDTFPWKQLYPDLFTESQENASADSEDGPNEIIQRIDIDGAYAANSADEGFFINIPSGIKSALFVSLAIVALSIVVFLAILVIFKWVQKKDRSLNYCSSLTTKFRPPVLQGRPTTVIKTFMNETLGRKKNYYKSSLQSMSDEIWDGNRERKESF